MQLEDEIATAHKDHDVVDVINADGLAALFYCANMRQIAFHQNLMIWV